MHLRNGTMYREQGGPHWHPNVDITTLPANMQWRPCPYCDRPRAPMSDPVYNCSKQEWSFMYATQQHYDYCRQHFYDADFAGFCHTHIEQASHYTWICLECNVVWWQPRFPVDGAPNRYDAKKLWQIFHPIDGQPTTSGLREYARRWRCKISFSFLCCLQRLGLTVALTGAKSLCNRSAVATLDRGLTLPRPLLISPPITRPIDG